MKRFTRIIKIAVGIFVIGILTFIILSPIYNDIIAKRTAKSIKDIQMPNKTKYIETFSKAGKLVGSGNGMQYLGGILIKSDLSLEYLQLYYSQFAKNEFECIVEKQKDNNIQIVEHGRVSLSTDINEDNYYIVYSWGDEDSVFSELDLRGH